MPEVEAYVEARSLDDALAEIDYSARHKDRAISPRSKWIFRRRSTVGLLQRAVIRITSALSQLRESVLRWREAIERMKKQGQRGTASIKQRILRH